MKTFLILLTFVVCFASLLATDIKVRDHMSKMPDEKVVANCFSKGAIHSLSYMAYNLLLKKDRSLLITGMDFLEWSLLYSVDIVKYGSFTSKLFPKIYSNKYLALVFNTLYRSQFTQ